MGQLRRDRRWGGGGVFLSFELHTIYLAIGVGKSWNL